MKKGMMALVAAAMIGTAGMADTMVSMHGHAGHDAAGEHKALQETAAAMVGEILRDNGFYRTAKGEKFFEAIKNGQTPRATVVSCSDSRVQMAGIDATSENDLFVIRNIGNQITSNEGSVAYGVHHLHTPLLLIVGHTRCGAVKAAMGDYASESSAIRREVDTLSLSMRRAFETGHTHGGNEDWVKGVVSNVNMQVAYALQSYGDEVKSGELTVVGVVFDLADDFGDGYGKLKIVNINGQTDAASLAASPVMKAAAHR